MNIQPELPDISSVMREAAVNVKVEKARALELQIQAYRAMNIKEADEIANILEEQMILLCEDRLDRVAVQKAVERIAEKNDKVLLELYKKERERKEKEIHDYLDGVSHTFTSNVMGLVGWVSVPIANVIKFFTNDNNYVTHEEYMQTVEELLEESSLLTEDDITESYIKGREHGEVYYEFVMYEFWDSFFGMIGSKAGTGKNETIKPTGGSVHSNKDFDVTQATKMTKEYLRKKIPENWKYEEHNGFVHIKDADDRMRIRIDPPDKVTQYTHMHLYDGSGNSLNSTGTIVNYKDPSGHIPYNN